MSVEAALLTVESLVKRFDGGAVKAVDGISFDVGASEFFTLLGPSGCGKTTTLRCLAGLERPDAGRIVLDGRVLCDAAAGIDVGANARGLGLVFQSYAIWPHMNVFDNVAFPLTVVPRRRRPARREVRERVMEVLSVVKLDDLAARPATDLSGGQQQRLALARALVMRPPLLLLDEPLSNLDARLRDEMRVELKRLQRELHITCVYVTHDQVEALAMSNRIAIVLDGRIEQVGPPREVYQRPGSRFVADFVGAANLIDGVVQHRGHDGSVLVETAMGPVRALANGACRAGAGVLLVVRPEHVTLTPAADGAAPSAARGRVLGTGYLGDAVDHLVAVGPLILRARTTPARSLAHGTEVAVGFPAEHCTIVPREA